MLKRVQSVGGRCGEDVCLKGDRIVISNYSIKHRSRISRGLKELVGGTELEEIVSTCKSLYNSNSKGFFRSGTFRKGAKTRYLVDSQILPYLDKVNANLKSRGIGVYFRVESVYDTVFSNVPTYFLVPQGVARPQFVRRHSEKVARRFSL
mmetsp:Transcript_8616/g.13974  ORF Transcript_8616/g.13974 Transcript_8616/m.13974 type:complete len:150 (+) Transcript_8616:20-469(+)